MGGYGSSRWEGTLTRTSTEGLLRLDVRALARAGGLRGGVRANVVWECGASVATEVPRDDPSTMLLRFHTRVRTGAWTAITEPVSLAWTRCAFGGRRVWFTCPGCRTRRAVLYAVAGRFRCRACHRLAYASTRR
jgi:hypothetical protein